MNVIVEESDIVVGIIVRPHGLQGMVKVLPVTDDPNRFLQLEEVAVCAKGRELGRFQVEKAAIAKKYTLLKLHSFDTCEDVEPLRGAELRIRRSECLPTKDNQYYQFEIMGLSVLTVDGRAVGRIVEIMASAANDVWVVADDDGNETLIPAIGDIVKKVDLDQRKILIEPMEGLL